MYFHFPVGEEGRGVQTLVIYKFRTEQHAYHLSWWSFVIFCFVSEISKLWYAADIWQTSQSVTRDFGSFCTLAHVKQNNGAACLFVYLLFVSGELKTITRWWSLCTLYLHACQVRVTTGDSGLCCCTRVKYFEHWLTPLCVDSGGIKLSASDYDWCPPDGGNEDCASWQRGPVKRFVFTLGINRSDLSFDMLPQFLGTPAFLISSFQGHLTFVGLNNFINESMHTNRQ